VLLVQTLPSVTDATESLWVLAAAASEDDDGASPAAWVLACAVVAVQRDVSQLAQTDTAKSGTSKLTAFIRGLPRCSLGAHAQRRLCSACGTDAPWPAVDRLQRLWDAAPAALRSHRSVVGAFAAVTSSMRTVLKAIVQDGVVVVAPAARAALLSYLRLHRTCLHAIPGATVRPPTAYVCS